MPSRSNKNIISAILFLALLSLASSEALGSSQKFSEKKQELPEEYRQLVDIDNVEVEYWENGNVRLWKESNDLGKVVLVAYCRQDGSVEREETFDDRGNKQSIAYFNSQGGLRTGSDGWAAVIWKYDNGIMRGQGYYDLDGNLTRYKVYNAAGDLVTKKYIGDKEPDLNELYSTRSTTLAPQSFEFYDSYGRPTGKVTSYRDTGWFPYSYPYQYYGGHPYGPYDRYKYRRENR